MSDTAQIPSTEGTTVGETPLTTQETAVIQEETPVVIPPAEETPAPVSTETTPEEPVLTDEQIQAIVDELSKDISI